VGIQAFGKGDWERFNSRLIPAERKDLVAERPDKVQALRALAPLLIAMSGRTTCPPESLRVRDAGRTQLPPRTADDPGLPAAFTYKATVIVRPRHGG